MRPVHLLTPTTLLVLVALATAAVPRQAIAQTPWFEDGFEWNDVGDAKANGPWDGDDGDVSISTSYAHTGSKSIKICYASNESQSYIAFDMPGMTPGANNGETHVFLRWWELRAADYDWGGEKFNRVAGRQANGNVSLDYPLGWVADGGWGQPGMNDAGSIQMFGNSSPLSNGGTHWSYTYKMPREEWHLFEYEIKLNDVGKANGETRLWIDNAQVAEATELELRYTGYTLDTVWIGGWYSGGVDPEPGPACRYVDDVSARSDKRTTLVSPPKAPLLSVQ